MDASDIRGMDDLDNLIEAARCRRDKSSLDMAIGHLPQQPSG